MESLGLCTDGVGLIDMRCCSRLVWPEEYAVEVELRFEEEGVDSSTGSSALATAGVDIVLRRTDEYSFLFAILMTLETKALPLTTIFVHVPS
mmetsp:Transcript_34531/g.55565  ORF Transcript_34531/g.55565 Transcript_34531/m.55565 type:complete len:92 (-) Transcript_34531:215-490(-)